MPVGSLSQEGQFRTIVKWDGCINNIEIKALKAWIDGVNPRWLNENVDK